MNNDSMNELLELRQRWGAMQSAYVTYVEAVRLIDEQVDTGLPDVDINHDLVIQLGDEEFHAHCTCGVELGMIKPDKSFDVFALRWERHVMRIQA